MQTGRLVLRVLTRSRSRTRSRSTMAPRGGGHSHGSGSHSGGNGGHSASHGHAGHASSHHAAGTNHHGATAHQSRGFSSLTPNRTGSSSPYRNSANYGFGQARRSRSTNGSSHEQRVQPQPQQLQSGQVVQLWNDRSRSVSASRQPVIERRSRVDTAPRQKCPELRDFIPLTDKSEKNRTKHRSRSQKRSRSKNRSRSKSRNRNRNENSNSGSNSQDSTETSVELPVGADTTAAASRDASSHNRDRSIRQSQQLSTAPTRQSRSRSQARSRDRSSRSTRSQSRQRSRSQSCGPIPKLSEREENQLRTLRRALRERGTAADLPPLVIYTDGSVIQNRSTGIAGFVAPGHPLNFSKCLKDVTEHNSGYAEIRAVCEALQSIAGWSGYQGQHVIVKTDYLSTVHALKRSSNPNLRFNPEYEQMYRMAKEFPGGVAFEHVYGHNGDPNNEQVDQMANSAARGHPLLRSQSADPGSRRERSRSHGRRRATSAGRTVVSPKAQSPKLSPELDQRLQALRNSISQNEKHKETPLVTISSTYVQPIQDHDASATGEGSQNSNDSTVQDIGDGSTKEGSNGGRSSNE